MNAILYRPETESELGGVGYHVRFDDGDADDEAIGFDGPLELLLRMVREGKTDPLEIEIASITRQYVETLELLEALDLRVGSEFLKLATTLIRIKARRLLPRKTTAAAGEEEDPEAALEARLRDYARYRDAARKLRRSIENRNSVWIRGRSLPDAGADANGNGAAAAKGEELQVDLFAVVEAFRRVVVRARSRPPVPAPKKRISIAVLIRRFEKSLPAGANRDFEDLLFEVIEGNVDRPTLVAAFLAVLELARRGRISVGQEQDFGPIRIEALAAA